MQGEEERAYRERERLDELLEDEGSMPRWPNCDLAPEDAIDGFLLKNEHAAEAHTDTRRRDMFFSPPFFLDFFIFTRRQGQVSSNTVPPTESGANDTPPLN